MTYAGLRGVVDERHPELGGNVHHGDPFSFAPHVWKYLIRRFGVRSVLDVGSGEGHAANFFHAELGCITIAIDGLDENRRGAVYPIGIHDLRQGPFRINVDLVHCVEMVEHLAEKYVQHLLETLTCGRVLAMTHALPEQGGYHHVNCQPIEYWQNHLARFDFALAVEDTARVRRIAEKDGAIHFQTSGAVFTKLR